MIKIISIHLTFTNLYYIRLVMIYYTSDLHLGHRNVIRYSNRPFLDIDDMNQTIIANINSRVGKHDTLNILGDVALCNIEQAEKLLNQIICEDVHLISGNHDPTALQKLPIWKSVSQIREVKDFVDGVKHHVTLCHYKMVEFNRSHYGALQLFGHAHGAEEGNQQQIDVGVDCWDYMPVTLAEAKARMDTLPPMPRRAHSAT